MVDEGVKITVRITNDVIQLMEDFMGEHMIENRSDFVRDAIRGYISTCKAPENPNGAITVPLNPIVIQTLENMEAEGIIGDKAAYIAGLVNNDVIPKEVVEESKARAFKAAQQSSRMM